MAKIRVVRVIVLLLFLLTVVTSLFAQAIAIVGTLVILKIVDVTIGLRVTQDQEIEGLDLSQHG